VKNSEKRTTDFDGGIVARLQAGIPTKYLPEIHFDVTLQSTFGKRLPNRIRLLN
jgi:hypothetical protein